jgi:hypothetical protein
VLQEVFASILTVPIDLSGRSSSGCMKKRGVCVPPSSSWKKSKNSQNQVEDELKKYIAKN